MQRERDSFVQKFETSELYKRVAIIVLYFFNMFIGSSLIMQLVLDEQMAFNLTLAVDLLLFIIAIWIYRTDFKLPKINGRFVLQFIGKLVLAYVFYFVLADFLPGFLPIPEFQNNEAAEQMLDSFSRFLMLEIGVMGPIKEELVFRRSMIIKQKNNKLLTFGTLFLSSLIFGFLHFQAGDTFIVLIPYILSGLALGFIYIKTDSIVFPILVHIINNSLFVFC